MKILQNKNLKNLNTYKLDVTAKYFCVVKNKRQLLEVFDFVKQNKVKYFILGKGANVIFLDKKYDGLVIIIENNYTRWENKNRVWVNAGRIWDNFLDSLQKRAFYSIQSLAGIPGTVGAGVFGNIGAFGQEIKKFVRKVEVLNLKTGKLEIFENKQLDFSYRQSFFKRNKGKYLIWRVQFDFSKKFQNSLKDSQREYFSL